MISRKQAVCPRTVDRMALVSDDRSGESSQRQPKAALHEERIREYERRAREHEEAMIDLGITTADEELRAILAANRLSEYSTE